MIATTNRSAARRPVGHEPIATLSPGAVESDRMTERAAAKRDFTRAIGEQTDALYGLAMRLTRNAADAEDLVAETVTKAWLAIDTLDEREQDGGDEDVVSLLIQQSDEFLHWWADPETEVANRLLGEQIMAAIEELPECFREAILLVNVEGLRYDEAAELLGVPKGTIRSRMKRGRTLLQKALWIQARDAGLIPDRESTK